MKIEKGNVTVPGPDLTPDGMHATYEAYCRLKRKLQAAEKELGLQLANLGELRRHIEIENRPYLIKIIDTWATELEVAITALKGDV